MRKGERVSPLPQLDLRPLYRLGEPVEFLHLSRFVSKQLLDERYVKWIRIGRWDFLSVSESEETLPLLWKSICASSLVGRGRERAGRQEQPGVTTRPLRNPPRSR